MEMNGIYKLLSIFLHDPNIWRRTLRLQRTAEEFQPQFSTRVSQTQFYAH